MKKSIIIVCLAILPIAYANAQRPYYGIKAGVNSSNLTASNGGNSTDYKIGFNAGLLAHIHAGKHVALQPEINYSEQGGKVNYATSNYVAKLSYIQVPLLVQYMFGPGYRIQAGPQVSFLTSATGTTGGNVKQNIKGNYTSTDVSVSVGAGILTNTKFGIDVRWNFGLSDINNTNTNVNVRNNVGQLSLFYMFNHRGK